MTHDQHQPARGTTRRTVLASAAWAGPVIAVAAAAPGAAASTETGEIVFSPVQYRGTRVGDRVEFPTLTGVVTVENGPMPTTVHFEFSEVNEREDIRRDAGSTVPIDPSTGRFEIDGVYNAIVGGENPFGFIYARVLDNNGVDFGQAIGELDG